MLLCFDIDGTLLQKASAAHAQALHQALREVYGLREFAQVPAAGRTDIEIARAILAVGGVGANRVGERLDELRARTCEEFARLCPPDLSGHVPAGMGQLLQDLSRRDGVRLSLITGNLEPVARLKLARAALGSFFALGQGAFGSDSEDRTDLPAIARARAGEDGVPYPRERTIVIGDTPLDIACARADGVRCFAVTTGPCTREQLAGADQIAADATELGALLEVALV